jgi:hypothetical protein
MMDIYVGAAGKRSKLRLKLTRWELMKNERKQASKVVNCGDMVWYL